MAFNTKVTGGAKPTMKGNIVMNCYDLYGRDKRPSTRAVGPQAAPAFTFKPSRP